jgi:CTP:molybdopterin cytidylyltransferase MocA
MLFCSAMLASVILAAGASRRMGRPKALLPYPLVESTPGKVTFLEHLIGVSKHPRVGHLRVVLGADSELIRRRVRLKPDCTVINEQWEQGQLSSLQAAIRSLPDSTDGIIMFLVDHPLVSAKLTGRLIHSFYRDPSRIVVPTHQGKRGHPVIFPARLYAELLAAPLDTGARAVVHAHESEIFGVETDEEGIVLNLNDPQAYRRLTGG